MAILLAMICSCLPLAASTRFFVAVDGSDTNPGTGSQPFATLERARDAVRAERLGASGTEAGTVWIRGGSYFRNTEFLLGARDSGSDGAPIVYKAHPGETPRFIGGVAIGPASFSAITTASPLWHRLDPAARGKIVVCDLPALGITGFGDLTSSHADPIHSELSFNGEILPLGRWPNEDFAVVYRALSDTTFAYDHNRPDRWVEATAPWVNGYWRYLWANKYLPVTAIDTVANVFSIADRPGYAIATGRFWYGLNLVEEIDRPGEWYLERNRDAPDGAWGRLYLWPPQDLRSGEILLSLHGGDGAALVRLDSVSNVRFEGLTFELTRADGIVIADSREVVIDGCVVRNIGRHGVTTSNCRRVGVQNSELYAIGSEGVRLAGGDRHTLTPGGNYVRNCHIHNFSRWKRTYSQAVRFDGGVGNEATHNLIHGTPHIAIQYSGNDHLIQYNEIFDACWETGDAGVIMGDWGWDSRGNRVVDNYLHDNVSRRHGRGGFNAIYLDGSCAGDTIAGNVIYNSGDFGVMHNSGREVVIDNNIFVGSKAAIHASAHAWYDTTPGHAMNFLDRIRAFDYREPPWSTAYPELAKTPDDRDDPDFERYKFPIGSLLVRNLSWRNDYWIDPRREEAFGYYDLIADNIDGQVLRCTPSDVAGCRQAVIACDGSVGRSVPSAPYVWNIGMG